MNQNRKTHLSRNEKYHLLKQTGLTENDAVDLAFNIDHFTFLQLRELAKVIHRIAKGNPS